MTNQDEFIDSPVDDQLTDSHKVEAQSLPAVPSAKELDDFQSGADRGANRNGNKAGRIIEEFISAGAIRNSNAFEKNGQALECV